MLSYSPSTMTGDRTLKLSWEKALNGAWTARTADVDGWMIVMTDEIISIATSEGRNWSRLRVKKDRFDAMLEAEDWARMHVLKRFGALLT